MSGCGGPTDTITGIGRDKVPVVALIEAINHFFLNGNQNCAGGKCENGKCRFAITQLPQISGAMAGSEFEVTVRGDGLCVCVEDA